MRPDAARRFVVLATACGLAVSVAGCGIATPAAKTKQRSAIATLPDDADPRPEPRSKYGNGPVYEVFGEQYTVLPSGDGYRERGVASWYGKKFHGRLTSNREPYDMYAMTAAHKTLPLPTYVRVRNLRNDRSVVVRVNDRGPFVHNRIIDLSYAAALKLDMVQDGTSLVEVTAITFDEPAGDRPGASESIRPVAGSAGRFHRQRGRKPALRLRAGRRFRQPRKCRPAARSTQDSRHPQRVHR